MTTFDAIVSRAKRTMALVLGIVVALSLSYEHVAGQVGSNNNEEGIVLSTDDTAVRSVMEVQDLYTDLLLDVKDVKGTGTGLSDAGELAILVFTETQIPEWQLPPELDGIPVLQRVMGESSLCTQTTPSPAAAFKTMSTNSTTNTNPKSRFTRPVPIGVSAANYAECGGGTIGARVTDGTYAYILSCNHVFARLNAASIGELVSQPGRVDIGCAVVPGDTIGRLTDFQPIVYSPSTSLNAMDAAMVQVDPDAVGVATPSNGYGTPSATIVSPSLNMIVQKYGRGTGLTTGKIIAVNTTIVISYPAGATRFEGQIVLADYGGIFAGDGDSGSLMVTNNSSANPVGLVFGRSGTYTFASPIGPILTRFDVTIDDGTTTLLPVELTYFSGNMMDQDVHLKWRTETEVQNHAFHVQRSSDKNSWDDITVIAGAGTSNTPRSYNHVDAGIGARFQGQRLYYRLLQIDLDGTENFSSVLEIEPLPTQVKMQIYPNPVRSDATVKLSINEPTDGILHVYDASGRLLPQYTQNLYLFDGTNNVPLMVSSATPGNYFVEFRSDRSVVRQRMLVIR